MKNMIVFLFSLAMMIGGWNCSGSATSDTANSAAITGTESNAAQLVSNDVVEGVVTFKGNIANASNMTLFIDKSTLTNSNEVVGRTTINADGSFETALKTFSEGIYRLRIGVQRFYLPLTGQEKEIVIKGDLNSIKLYDFSVKGSKTATEFAEFMNKFNTQKIDGAKAKTLIEEVEDPLVAMQLAFQTQGGIGKNNIDLHKKISLKMGKAYPQTSYLPDYNRMIRSTETQLKAMAAGPVTMGKPAPDIALPGLDGKVRKLSDYKGKVVLLDFWASWCGPCRRANPHVVEIYNKYKDQGFEVFSVSLDGIHPRMLSRLNSQDQIDQQKNMARQKWEAAIKKDGLIWDGHVSDLEHWNSPVAKTYGVRGIPKTFLIDRNGNVAANGVNPLQGDLEAQVRDLLKG